MKLTTIVLAMAAMGIFATLTVTNRAGKPKLDVKVAKVVTPSIAPTKTVTPSISPLARQPYGPQRGDNVYFYESEIVLAVPYRLHEADSEPFDEIIDCYVDSGERSYRFCVNTVDIRDYLHAVRHIENRTKGVQCTLNHDHQRIERQAAHIIGDYKRSRAKYRTHWLSRGRVFVQFHLDFSAPTMGGTERILITVINCTSNVNDVKWIYAPDPSPTVLGSMAE
jgi:hypothetical protein